MVQLPRTMTGGEEYEHRLTVKRLIKLHACEQVRQASIASTGLGDSGVSSRRVVVFGARGSVLSVEISGRSTHEF